MSPALSAHWLTVNSFGVPLIVVGLTVLWLARRGITPPQVIAWTLGIWTVADAVMSGPGPQGLILLLACVLPLLAARRAARLGNPARHADTTRTPPRTGRVR